jgi:hypothetical protein
MLYAFISLLLCFENPAKILAQKLIAFSQKPEEILDVQ